MKPTMQELQRRSAQRAKELRRAAKQPETAQDRRNLRIIMRSCGFQTLDRMRGGI